MTQPSPETWWAELNDEDRRAYTEAAVTTRTISRELWLKLGEAGAATMPWVTENETDFHLPRSYLRFVLDQANGRRGSANS